MLLNKRYLVIAIAISIAGFTYFSLKPIEKKFTFEQETREAAANVMSLYLEEGILGLIALSKECYEHDKISAETCFINDVTSKALDVTITNAMKVPAEEYFFDDSVVQRLLKHDKKNYFTKENTSVYISQITKVAEDQLVIEWNLQKHKLESNE